MSKSPHDALFKGIFKNPNNASQVLRTALPTGLVHHLDFRTLRLEDGSFINKALRSRYSDLLFSIKAGDRSARLYLLYEHQSEESPLMAYRMLGYMVAIWDRYVDKHPNATRLPAVIPVVLHHGAGGWTVPTSMQQLYDLSDEQRAHFAPHLPSFSFILDDLAGQSDADLRQRAIGAIPTLVLWLFKHGRSRAFEDSEPVLAAMREQIADLLVQALNAPSGVHALAMLMQYTLEVTGVEPAALERTLTIDIDPRFSEAIMTGADILRQEGREQGRAVGRRELLRKQLGLKFGPLPASAQTHIDSADVTDLDRFGERLLTANSLDEVLTKQ